MNRFDSIQYMNVYSQKREFLYTDIEKEFREFITICRGNGLKLSGRIFYSIEHISKEGRVVAEFFYPSAHLKKVRNTMLHFWRLLLQRESRLFPLYIMKFVQMGKVYILL